MLGEKIIGKAVDKAIEKGPAKTAAVVATGVLAISANISYGIAHLTDAMYGTDRARAYLAKSGYTNLELEDTDHVFVDFKGCGWESLVKYEFEATALNGAETHIGVCKGFLENATIIVNEG